MTQPTVVQILAEIAITGRATPLTGEVAAAAERAVIDWLGAALGGSLETPARALIQGLTPLSGPSRLLGDHQTAPAPIAALVNGTAAHTLELDDIYAAGLFHPGAPVIAAALAVADLAGANGEAFLRAVVTGYEVGCRVAEDLGPKHYAHWHTTGTAGSLAAAAAAAELLGSGPEAFASALALAATMAGGVQQTFRCGAMGKPLHAGHAALAGVIAAVAAHDGVTGAPDVLEAEAGLGWATGAPSEWAHSRATAGPRPAITMVTVKPYPCCGHAFAVIDGVFQLRDRGLNAADVRRIDVHTYRTALEVAGIADPRTSPERKFSIPYLAAAALLAGGVGDTNADIDMAELRRLMATVQLHPDPGYEAAFPARRGARVTVTTQAGPTLTAEVPDRSGSPENPLSDGQVEQKFLTVSAPAVDERGPEILRQVRQLRDGGTVAGLPISPGAR